MLVKKGLSLYYSCVLCLFHFSVVECLLRPKMATALYTPHEHKHTLKQTHTHIIKKTPHNTNSLGL